MNQLQTKDIASSAKHPPVFVLVGMMLAVLMGVPGLLFVYREYLQQRIKTAIEGTPELATHLVQPEVDWSGVKLRGRLPHAHLREKAAQVTHAILPELTIQNQIEVIAAPINPMIADSEVKRVTQVLNQSPGNAIAATYRAQQVALRGSAASDRAMHAIVEAYRRIPGVRSVVSALQVRAKQLQFVFPPRSSVLDSPQQLQLRSFTRQHAQREFTILIPPNGLGRQRAIAMQRGLLQAGVSRDRIQVQAALNNPKQSPHSVWIQVN